MRTKDKEVDLAHYSVSAGDNPIVRMIRKKVSSKVIDLPGSSGTVKRVHGEE